MEILLATGRLAENRVRKIAERFDNCDVLVADVDVASCMSPAQLLSKIEDRGYDLIMVPGAIDWDLRKVEEKSGIKVFKGPKDVADLEFILENIGDIRLSKTVPACVLMQEELRSKALEELREVDSKKYRREMLKKPDNILVGSLPVGPDFPIRVLAEIVDATRLPLNEVKKRAEYFIASGADMIDIGVNEKDPEGVEEVINLLKDLDVPLGIDTMEKRNIEMALERNIDMIMSFDRELLTYFGDIKIPTVIIPKEGNIPKGSKEKVQILEENIELARENGFENIIADLILEPMNFGFTDSIVAYKNFADRHELPILMGIGNVSELMDADSVGINALLCGIAMECNASIVFTPEYSDKAKGGVKELASASKMMYLAKKRRSSPKDLGVDLLLLKEKRFKGDEFDEILYRGASYIQAKGNEKHGYDPEGFFKIFVDDDIKAVHFRNRKPNLVITGKNAKEISDTIFNLDLVSDMSHAFYLGRELEKAEIALKTGKSYVQDLDLF